MWDAGELIAPAGKRWWGFWPAVWPHVGHRDQGPTPSHCVHAQAGVVRRQAAARDGAKRLVSCQGYVHGLSHLGSTLAHPPRSKRPEPCTPARMAPAHPLHNPGELDERSLLLAHPLARSRRSTRGKSKMLKPVMYIRLCDGVALHSPGWVRTTWLCNYRPAGCVGGSVRPSREAHWFGTLARPQYLCRFATHVAAVQMLGSQP